MHWFGMKLRVFWKKGLKNIQNWWIEILMVIFLISAIILTWVGYVRITTGGWPDWAEFVAKILWDLTQLLIVPAVLAIGAYLLNESARKREQAIASDNRQETALQTYLDRMAELLLKENLRKSEQNAEVRAVARARTLTVLQRLGGERKGALLRFLYEADLIDKDKTVIILEEADLSGADMRNAYLNWTDLSEANLSGADLSGAYLSGADLSLAKMSGAYLIRANLRETDLSGAKLWGAKLIEADLIGADLIEADLSGAYLRDAKLSKAKLNLARLVGANLRGAYLRETDLSGAKYTRNAKDIPDTIWPDGFDPDAAGAICVNE